MESTRRLSICGTQPGVVPEKAGEEAEAVTVGPQHSDAVVKEYGNTTKTGQKAAPEDNLYEVDSHENL